MPKESSATTLKTAEVPASEVQPNEMIVVADEVYRVITVEGCGNCNEFRGCDCQRRFAGRYTAPRIRALRLVRLDADTTIEVSLYRNVDCAQLITVVVDDSYEPSS